VAVGVEVGSLGGVVGVTVGAVQQASTPGLEIQAASYSGSEQ